VVLSLVSTPASYDKDTAKNIWQFAANSYTYKIEEPSAQVHATLKMYLLVSVFPRATLQYVNVLSTQNNSRLKDKM